MIRFLYKPVNQDLRIVELNLTIKQCNWLDTFDRYLNSRTYYIDNWYTPTKHKFVILYKKFETEHNVLDYYGDIIITKFYNKKFKCLPLVRAKKLVKDFAEYYRL